MIRMIRTQKGSGGVAYLLNFTIWCSQNTEIPFYQFDLQSRYREIKEMMQGHSMIVIDLTGFGSLTNIWIRYINVPVNYLQTFGASSVIELEYWWSIYLYRGWNITQKLEGNVCLPHFLSILQKVMKSF